MKMEEKSHKTLIVWVAILSLLVLGLGGYIVYDKFIAKKDVEEKQCEKCKACEVCSDNESLNNSDSNNNLTDDIYEKLLNSDFSGVAGDYVNCDGKTITLLSTGLLQGENGFTIEKPSKSNNMGVSINGAYQWIVSGGKYNEFVRTLVPIGVSLGQVLTLNPSIIDDTTKIRLFSGQEFPGYEDIYFKK